MNGSGRLAWILTAIEMGVLGAVVFLAWQTRTTALGIEHRVRAIENRLADVAMPNQPAANPAALQFGGIAAMRDQEVLAQRIAEILRTTERCSTSPSQGAPTVEPDEEREQSPEVEKQVGEAGRIVSDALSRGRLERQAVTKLRELQAASGGDPRFVAMRDQVIAAINQQQLVPEDVAFVAF